MVKVKFAHVSDCHLGSWRNEKLQELSISAFKFFINFVIKEKVDFVLISGDLFDVAIPSIDILKITAEELKKLKDNNIKVYIIAGSHDFSPSGKSMLSVLEKTGLFVYLKDDFSIYKENNLVISYLTGKKSGLEIENFPEFKKMCFEIPKGKDIIKICMLHTTIKEFLTEKLSDIINSIESKDLPDGFDYYAFGHLHNKIYREISNKKIAYPGALFPNNFLELKENKKGNFYIIEIDTEKSEEEKLRIRGIEVELKKILFLEINSDNKTPQDISKEILDFIKNREIKDKILLLKIYGTLENGRPSEINFRNIEKEFEKNKGYCLLRNTSKLKTKEFKIDEHLLEKSTEKIEDALIEENLQGDIENEKTIFKKLMNVLNKEKKEGETKTDFIDRLSEELIKELNLNDIW